jgi:hypothetical protein
VRVGLRETVAGGLGLAYSGAALSQFAVESLFALGWAVNARTWGGKCITLKYIAVSGDIAAYRHRFCFYFIWEMW